MSFSLIKRLLLTAALVLAPVGARAYAQDVVDVKVPFDFTVNGRAFPAGDYVVTLEASGAGVMSLRGDREQAFTFALTIPASGHDPAGERPALVFNHRENTYVLSQVWESPTQGRELVKG